MAKHTFGAEGEKVTVHIADLPDRASGSPALIPMVYLHVFEGDGTGVWQRLEEEGDQSRIALAAIAPRSWNNDLTPWPCPPVFRGNRPYEGLALVQLHLLESQIVPQTQALLTQHGVAPSFSALVGYSLAGLFSVWVATRSAAFERVASVSGSLWYPGFSKYVAGHIHPSVRRAYFSLGDKESHTRNPVMKTVLENTQQIVEKFEQAGADTCFELNPGNHFVDEDLRTARGIRWLLGGGPAAAVPTGERP